MSSHKKRLSLYTTSGEVAGTTYYRIYQYLYNDKYEINKRQRFTNRMYSEWMPISSKGLMFKIYTFLILYIRQFSHLFKDCLNPPKILVLSRGLLTRVLPPTFKFMISYLHRKGTKFIWDFDDDIIHSKEFLKKDFDWFSGLASNIIVASNDNLDMLEEQFRIKAIVLPTTDRDMYKLFNKDLTDKRVETLKSQHRLIWVGSATSLPFLKKVMGSIEKYAKSNLDFKVVLTVVCNKPLNYNPHNFELRNVKWSRDIAIEEMKNSHIGLMPLEDNISTRRKGGFKLIQYLSIGLPVIGSPIGINDRIITKDVGFKATIDDPEMWVNAMNDILSSPDIFRNYSINAYNCWLENYNYEENLKVWEDIISNIIEDE